MGIITDIEHYRDDTRRKPYKGPINGPCSACSDGDTAMKYHDHEPLSPSYTLAELEQLAQRYTREYQMSIDDELGEFLQLSPFIAWLAKKEREANERG